MNSLTTKMRIASLIFILLASGTAVNAQCSGGVNTGGGNCTPPTAPGMPAFDSTGSGNAMPPAPAYTSQWGAIVIDGTSGGAGTVTGRDTEKAAIRDATRDCESHGASGCKLALTYANSCAAIAWSDQGYGVASQVRSEDANNDAMDGCRKHHGECKIVYSDCSMPRRLN